MPEDEIRILNAFIEAVYEPLLNKPVNIMYGVGIDGILYRYDVDEECWEAVSMRKKTSVM